MKRSAFKAKPKSPSPSKPLARKPITRKPAKKKPPKRKDNQDFYDAWGKRHDSCQCCGIGRELAEFLRFPGLSTHHIAKAGRVHTATNIIRLCQRCHDSAENLSTPVWLPDGRKWYYPFLKFPHCHWLKLHREPAEYDAETLTRLRMGILHPPEEPHPVYQAEYLARQGRTTKAAEVLAGCDFPGTLDDLLGATTQPRER